jgi:hypothetical protein
MPTIGIELDLCVGARAGTGMALDDLIRFAAGARGRRALVPVLVVFRSAITPLPLAKMQCYTYNRTLKNVMPSPR